MGMRDKYRQSGGVGVNLALIITPMLDMSFQILSFFIMTYHPSALEGHIPGSLAPPETVATKSKDNVVLDIIPPSVPEDMLLPEIQEAPTVVIKLADAGQPGKVYIKTKLEQPDEVADAARIGWNESPFKPPEPTARDLLKQRLKQLQKDGALGDKANIKIEADGDILQDYIMQTYDVCKQSGFPKIHFVPPPLMRQGKE